MDVLRVFVGGLPRHIEPEELTSRFVKFGKVLDVEVKNKLDATGEWLKTFGYLNLETTWQSFQKCRSQLNNSTWRDGRLTIQLAKQDISVRYAEERKQRAAEPELTKSAQREMTSQQQLSVIPREMKGAVPGTPVPDTEDWVVTKFQRVVPIMNVRSKDKKKVVRYDPSKHCHQIKRLDAEKKNSSTEEVTQKQQSVSELTWSLDDPVFNGNSGNTDNQINYRKRIGDYSGLLSPAKKKKSTRSAPEVIQQEKEKRAQLLAEAILNDDMEVVSSGQTLTTSKPNTPVSGDSGVVQSNIDLSRFDSDCDDSDEPDSSVTPKATNKVSTNKESLVNKKTKPQKANEKSASSVVVKKIAKVTPKAKTNKPASSSSSDSSDSESTDDEKPATVTAPKRTRTPFRGTVSSDNVKKDPVVKKPEAAQMNTKKAMKKSKNRSDSSSSDSSSSDSSSSESESSDSDTNRAKMKSAAKTKGAKLPKEAPAVASLQAPVKPSVLKSKTNTVNAVKSKSEESSSDSPSSDSESSDKETTTAKVFSVNTQKPVSISPKKTAAVTPLPVTAKPDKRTESLKPDNKPDAVTPAATPGQDNLAAILSNAANSMKSGNMTEQFALLLETAAQIIKSAGQPSNVNTENSLASSMSLAENKPDMVLQPKTLEFSDNENSVLSSPSIKTQGDEDKQSTVTPTEHRKPGGDSSSSSDSDNSISDKTKPLRKSSTRKYNKSTNIEPSHDSKVTAAKEKSATSSGVNGITSYKSSSSNDSELSSSDSDDEEEKQPLNTSQTENRANKAPIQKSASNITEKRSSSEDSSESETDSEEKPTDKTKTSPAQVENESSSSSSSESESDSDTDSSGDDKPTKVSTVQSKAPARKAPSVTNSTNKQSVNKGAKKEKVLTQGEKRALANQKRLEAMSNKQKELSTQQKAIQQSLKNMDTPANNKKVVFGSDSESEEADGEKSKEAAAAAEQQKTLFDGSSDEEGGDDYDKMFAIKPQFEGEKGAKLLSLQKTFSDDSRFKLTEKFLESDDSDEESKMKDKDSSVADVETEEVDGAAERRRNLEILQSIVGSRNVKIDHPTAKTKKIADTPATVFRDISSMQFDPTSEANDNLIKKIAPSESKPKKKKKKQEGSEPVVGSEPAPEITQDRFFEVAADFTQKSDTAGNDTATNTVTNDSGTGGMVFNFLGDKTKSSSESESSDEEEKSESDEDMDTEEKGQDAGYINRKFTNPFDVENGGRRFDDESDSDNEAGGDKAEDNEQSGKKETKAPMPVLPNTVVDWFFFKPTDPRLAEGSKRFSRTLDDTQIKKQWEQVRPKLVESYMTKSKRAALKLKKRKTSIVKKRLEAKATRKGKGPSRGRR